VSRDFQNQSEDNYGLNRCYDEACWVIPYFLIVELIKDNTNPPPRTGQSSFLLRIHCCPVGAYCIRPYGVFPFIWRPTGCRERQIAGGILVQNQPTKRWNNRHPAIFVLA